jgi:hypothetical protein
MEVEISQQTGIVPLCLYYNNSADASYIAYPNKTLINGKEYFSCATLPGLSLISVFYAIDPDVRPLPRGTMLICPHNDTTNYITVKVNIVYDIYNIDTTKNCAKFITWLQPVPYATPLYIFNRGNSNIITFDPHPPDNYTANNLAPLYVFLNPQNTFPTITENGISSPRVLFSCQQERCVPDPQGTFLRNCIISCTKQIACAINKRPSILSYLSKKKGHSILDQSISPTICVFVTIVLIILLYFFLKTPNKKGWKSVKK